MSNNPTTDLAAAVTELAAAAQPLSDADLGQPLRWGAHSEGARFALLGSMHELRALAVRLAAERRRDGPAVTRAQHALGQYHAAYRDLAAALLGVTDEEFDREPALGEWSLREVYGHMIGAERAFFTLVHYGLRRQRESGADLSPELPEGEVARVLGPYASVKPILQQGSPAEMAQLHAHTHDVALDEFAGISDEEIDGSSIWWEGEPYSLEYRLHRFDAHLRQHTIQVERTLDQLGRPANEARRLIRQLYAALAEVEAQRIGAPDLGTDGLAELAGEIRQRARALGPAVARAAGVIAAVKAGDADRVSALLAEDAEAANALDGAGVPALRVAAYYGQPAIAEQLAEHVQEMEIWDAVVLGRLPLVTEMVEGWGGRILDAYSRDGYTPLQLASFFGKTDVARYLLEQGADVAAVSRNPMAIQPLHAAAAANHTEVVRLLLDAGADPNAVQQDSFRPLHAAAQNGNAEMVALLLERGADPALADAKGRTARDLATEAGHEAVLPLLAPA